MLEPGGNGMMVNRCGNIRKSVIRCNLCPQTFCTTCANKMIEMDGADVFINGCPVCNNHCCCGPQKSELCKRTYHCYKKCPATKTPRESLHKISSGSEEQSGNCTASSSSKPKKNGPKPVAQPAVQVAGITSANTVEASPTVAKVPSSRKRSRPVDSEPIPSKRERVPPKVPVQQVMSIEPGSLDQRPGSILHPVSFTPVNNVFFLQSALPTAHPLPSIQPLMDIRRPSNYVYDLSGCMVSAASPQPPHCFTPSSKPAHPPPAAGVFTPSELSLVEDGLLFSPGTLDSQSSSKDSGSARFDKTLASSAQAVYESDDSSDLIDTVHQMLEYNNRTMKGLYENAHSVSHSSDSIDTEDIFSFPPVEALVTPIAADKMLDVSCSLPTNWTGQSFDLGGVVYSPVGFVDICAPPVPPPCCPRVGSAPAAASLRELSSLFSREVCGDSQWMTDSQGAGRTDSELPTAASQVNQDLGRVNAYSAR